MVVFKDSSESSQKVVLYKKTQVENGFQHHCRMWSELSNSVKKKSKPFLVRGDRYTNDVHFKVKKYKNQYFQPIPRKMPHDHDFRNTPTV